jgi:hypothetical protein
MAERIRLNPVGGNMAAPKMPAPMAPVHMAARIPGAVGMHSYLGHFATPTNLRAGHNTNWIAKATSNSHGQFRAKAQAAGMSTKAYANKEAGAPGKTGKQARLAKTLMGMH